MPSTSAHVNFVRQQGIDDPSPPSCESRYPPLMFQPRVILVLLAAGVATQSGLLFLWLSAVLWLSALLPALNPFDHLYNAIVRRRVLLPAPAPRRFSQGMAATFLLLIGVSLQRGWVVPAIVLQAVMLAAVSALVFGSFCLGSFVYHVLTGNSAFARRTLPWS